MDSAPLKLSSPTQRSFLFRLNSRGSSVKWRDGSQEWKPPRREGRQEERLFSSAGRRRSERLRLTADNADNQLWTIHSICSVMASFALRYTPQGKRSSLGVLACPVKCRQSRPCEAGFHRGDLAVQKHTTRLNRCTTKACPARFPGRDTLYKHLAPCIQSRSFRKGAPFRASTSSLPHRRPPRQRDPYSESYRYRSASCGACSPRVWATCSPPIHRRHPWRG